MQIDLPRVCREGGLTRVVCRLDERQKFCGDGIEVTGIETSIGEDALCRASTAIGKVGFAWGKSLTKLLWKLRGPSTAVHCTSKEARNNGRQVATDQRGAGGPADHLWDCLYHAVSLIVREEKELVLLNRAAKRPAELVLVIGTSFSRFEEIGSVQFGVPQKLEDVAMKLVRPRFGDDVNLPAAVIPVFRVEVVRQNTKFGNRIEIANRSGARQARLLHRYPVQDAAVRRFARPVAR